MKIYTEIVYSWDEDKGKLVQESSKSYDYNGPLTLANGNETGFRQVTYLEYPSTIGAQGMGDNWISFKAFDFKSKNDMTLDIALYIPADGLKTGYKSSYESASLGAIGGVADKAAEVFQSKTTEGVHGKAGGLEGLKTLMAAQAKATSSEMGTVALLTGAKAIPATLGFGDTKTLMERTKGAVLNPYMVAAYKGPTDMREHKFSFKMMPQSAAESKTCVSIVNSFKRAMLPSHSGGENSTAPSMLFGYPDEFTIDYYVDGKPLKGNPVTMFNVGRSVLTACDLDYTTQDVPLFFDGTQYPVSIGMNLSFQEIGVMYREKIDQGF